MTWPIPKTYVGAAETLGGRLTDEGVGTLDEWVVEAAAVSYVETSWSSRVPASILKLFDLAKI